MLTSKKGISTRQLWRLMDFAAWYMAHRVRAASMDKDFHKLMGIVEVDETFVGGKAKNRHKNDHNNGPGDPGGRAIVAGAVSRKRNVVARVIANVKPTPSAGSCMKSVSDKVSLLVTDHWVGYQRISATRCHQSPRQAARWRLDPHEYD